MVVRSGFPIILTPDLPRLEEFYRAAFGAERTFAFTSEDGTVGYVSLALGGAELGIAADAEASGGACVEVWFYVDDVDEAFRAAVAAGGEPVGEPSDMSWGERVAHVRDPAGVLVNLGMPLP